MDNDLTRLMKRLGKVSSRTHAKRAKLFHVAQRVFETTDSPHVIGGAYNAAKAHSVPLAKDLVAAGAATDYVFPHSEFATEVNRLRDQQRADAKAKAAAKAAEKGK